MNLAPQTYRKAPEAQLLPSASAAVSLARGEPGAFWLVLASLGMRAALLVPVSVGLGGFMGVKPKPAIVIGLGCALAIEAAVLALAFRQESVRRKVPDELLTSDVPAAQLPVAGVQVVDQVPAEMMLA